MKVAEAKGAKYPLTKKWFLDKYPKFKTNDVAASEAALKEAEEELKKLEEELVKKAENKTEEECE